MGRYQRSLPWAFEQLINRISQDISYNLGLGYCKPSRIIFCVTVRCNLKCRHCAFPRTSKVKELTTEEWKKIILEVKDWLGPYRIQLAGGELFLRNDIPELVRFGQENDILMGIVSNGTLINDGLAKVLVKSGLSYLDISLDGIRPETHDYVRGVEGVYDKVRAAIGYLKHHRKMIDNNLSLTLATVIMGNNLDELLDIIRFAEEMGLDGVSFNPLGPPHDTNDPDWYKKSELWPHENQLEKLDEILDQLVAMKENGSRILNSEDQLLSMKEYFKNPTKTRGHQCKVGVTNLLLSCEGNVHACFHKPAFGQFGEPIKEAWYSERAKLTKADIKTCDHICSPGNFIYTRSIIKDIRRYLQFR